ncbi:hypothetical protein ABTF50_19490, partial [Acinetobacter baumannii]
LFHGPSADRDRTDRAITAAAADAGFFCAQNFPANLPVGRASRAEVLRIFQLRDDQTRPLWRAKFDPSHSNVYRGWFPRQAGFLTSKEGIDMG